MADVGCQVRSQLHHLGTQIWPRWGWPSAIGYLSSHITDIRLPSAFPAFFPVFQCPFLDAHRISNVSSGSWNQRSIHIFPHAVCGHYKPESVANWLTQHYPHELGPGSSPCGTFSTSTDHTAIIMFVPLCSGWRLKKQLEMLIDGEMNPEPIPIRHLHHLWTMGM